MLVGVSGIAGSGKDTVADFLVEHHGFIKVSLADEIKRTAKRWYDFSDQQLWGPSEFRNAPDERYIQCHIKAGHMLTEEALKEYPGGLIPQYLTPRYVLQFLGTEAGRNFYGNTWVDITIRTAKALEKGGCYYDRSTGLRTMSSVDGVMMAKTHVVVPDVRFKNEVKAIHEAGGKLVRVVRPGSGLQGAASQHQSETEQMSIPDTDFDFVLNNNMSLAVLKLQVDTMIDNFTGRIRPYDEALKDVPPFMR